MKSPEELYREGKSTLEIAEERNWSVSSVRLYLIKRGVKLRSRTAWRRKEGASNDQTRQARSA